VSYKISLISPAGKIFEGVVESAIAPGAEGNFEVLTGHAPMVVRLKAGTVTLRRGAQKTLFAIGSGVFEVDQRHNALLLSDSAIPQ